MEHKLELEWHGHVAHGRWAAAYRAFLARLQQPSGLKGLVAYVSHPSRRDLLCPHFLRQLALGVDFGRETEEDPRFVQGVAYLLHIHGSAHHDLARRAFRLCAERLWTEGIQIYAMESDRSPLPDIAWLFTNVLNDGVGSLEEAVAAGSDPCERLGFSQLQTLYVRATTEVREDVSRAAGRPPALQFCERVSLRIMEEYARAAADVVAQASDSELVADDDMPDDSPEALRQTAVDDVTRYISLSDPVDVFEGWRRQRVLGVLDRASLQLRYSEDRLRGVIDIYPRSDRSVEVLAWGIEIAPPREVLIEALWPPLQRAAAAQSMPHDLTNPAWLPYLSAWHSTTWDLDLRSDDRLLEHLTAVLLANDQSVPVVMLAWVQEHFSFEDVWDETGARWFRSLEPPSGVGIRLHGLSADRKAQPIGPTELRTAFHALAEAYAVEQDGEVLDPVGDALAGRTIFAIPSYRDDDVITIEQAAFGRAGSTVANSVFDWPERIADSFAGVDDKKQRRGPNIMLRNGLGTWINQAISPGGQALLSTVLSDQSPYRLRSPSNFGPLLSSLPPSERPGLADLLGSPVTAELWGGEFSWALAFAFGGAAHAVLEVTEALQERLDHTNISDEIPGWTLQGPSELSYIQFGTPKEIYRKEITSGEKRSHHTSWRQVDGIYVWSKERGRLGEPSDAEKQAGETTLDVAVAIVASDSFVSHDGEREGTHDQFRSFKWTGIDPRLPLNQLLETLSIHFADEDRQYAESKFSRGSNEAQTATIRDEWVLTFRTAMEAAAKVLLYIELKDARVESNNREYGDNVGRGQHPLLKPLSPSERRVAALHRAPTVLKRIRVGPVRFDDDQPGDDDASPQPGTSGGTRRPHWVTGYYRMQPFGPGLRDRKSKWIRPYVTGRKHLVGGAPRLYDAG